MISIDSCNIPDTAIPCDDAHGSVVPAKLTNALNEHVKEPEASPTTPSRTASKHNTMQTMNGMTMLAFEAVAALWSHKPERRFLQRIARSESSRWPIACNGGVRRPLAHSSTWRYNVRSAQRHHRRRDHKPLRRQLLGGGRVNRTSLQGPAAAEGESHAVAFPTRELRLAQQKG